MFYFAGKRFFFCLWNPYMGFFLKNGPLLLCWISRKRIFFCEGFGKRFLNLCFKKRSLLLCCTMWSSFGPLQKCFQWTRTYRSVADENDRHTHQGSQASCYYRLRYFWRTDRCSSAPWNWVTMTNAHNPVARLHTRASARTHAVTDSPRRPNFQRRHQTS